MSHSPGPLSLPFPVEGRVVADAEASTGGRLVHPDPRRETEISGLDSLSVVKIHQDRRAVSVFRFSADTPARGSSYENPEIFVHFLRIDTTDIFANRLEYNAIGHLWYLKDFS
jgi:hypothetical protein